MTKDILQRYIFIVSKTQHLATNNAFAAQRLSHPTLLPNGPLAGSIVILDDVIHRADQPALVFFAVTVYRSADHLSNVLGRCAVAVERVWSALEAGEELGVAYTLRAEAGTGTTELRMRVQEWACKHVALLDELKNMPASAYQAQREHVYEVNSRECYPAPAADKQEQSAEQTAAREQTVLEQHARTAAILTEWKGASASTADRLRPRSTSGWPMARRFRGPRIGRAL